MSRKPQKSRRVALLDSFERFALRDVGILIATLGCWFAAPESEFWQVTTGVLTGLCALLFHEWGHLYGAHRADAKVLPAPGLWSPFLFDLDSRNNSSEQFVTTSVWGFYATGAFLLVFLVALPDGARATEVTWWIALVLATLTVVIEFPIAWRVYRGRSIPPVEIFRRPRD